MFPIVVETAADAPHWLEQSSWASQIVLVAVAVVTLILGYLQIRANTRISHATLLLELDSRWDSDDMQIARTATSELENKTREEVSAANHLASDAAKQELIRAKWCEQLRSMRADKDSDYTELMNLLGFFETVGLMVKRRYISADDVMDLFLGPLVDMDTVFRDHIKEREKESGVLAGLYEHAFYLADLAKKAEVKKS